MSDLKNQIFALLKKCPDYICRIENKVDNFTEVTYYNGEFITYKLHLSPTNAPFVVTLMIYSNSNVFKKDILFTEKEFMEIKWKIEEWGNELETKAFNVFKEFAESEPNSMDDLLND